MTASQVAAVQDLAWNQGDPINLSWVIPGGAAKAGAHTIESPDQPILVTLTATVVVQGADALVTISGSAGISATIPVGEYHWRLQATGGVTRYEGKVCVVL